MYAVFYCVILWTVTAPVSLQVTSSLELLLEDGQQLTSTNLVNKRVTVVYEIESETTIGENFARIKTIQKGWKNLKVFSTEGQLKIELYEILSVGTDYYLKAGSFMKHLLSFTSNSSKQPGSKCIFPGRSLSNNTLNDDSLSLTAMFERIDDTWTPEAVSKDIGKINFLFSLANSFNSIGFDWMTSSANAVNEFDQLQKLIFPDSLNGHLETAPCLDTAKFEMVKVLNCDSNPSKLFCELEVSLPQTPVVYGKFIPLSYNGAQLRGPTGKETFVRHPESQEILLILCHDLEEVPTKVPICKQVDELKECLTDLLRHEIDSAISNCKYTYVPTPTVQRLTSEELLIQGSSDIHVAEGSKVIFHPLPMVIGSTEKVTVTVSDSEEYEYFGSGSKGTGIKISKLTKTQVNFLLLKATWDDAVYNFQIQDYVEYLALGLQLVFAPLTVVSLVLACMARRTSNQSRKKVEKDLKKRNFEENKRLLKCRTGK